MNTTEYLRSLQSTMQARPSSIGQVIGHRSQQIDAERMRELVREYSLNTIEGQEIFYSNVLIVPFLRSLPYEVGASLRHVVFGLLPTYEPNACAIRAPDGGLLVILHTDLLAAISFYNEMQWLAARHLMAGDTDQARELLRRGHHFIVNCFRNEWHTNYPALPPTLGEEDFLRVQMKTMANELFVVAHEFAHIHLGHLGTLRSESIGPRGKEVVVQRYDRRQQMELDADAQAVKWLANLYGRATGSTFLGLPSQSVALCVEVFMLLHIVEVNLMNGAATSSHPPALVRLKHISERCEAHLKPEDRDFVAEMIKNASDTESFKTKL